jgi:hypothetical protein
MLNMTSTARVGYLTIMNTSSSSFMDTSQIAASHAGGAQSVSHSGPFLQPRQNLCPCRREGIRVSIIRRHHIVAVSTLFTIELEAHAFCVRAAGVGLHVTRHQMFPWIILSHYDKEVIAASFERCCRKSRSVIERWKATRHRQTHIRMRARAHTHTSQNRAHCTIAACMRRQTKHGTTSGSTPRGECGSVRVPFPNTLTHLRMK